MNLLTAFYCLRLNDACLQIFLDGWLPDVCLRIKNVLATVAERLLMWSSVCSCLLWLVTVGRIGTSDWLTQLCLAPLRRDVMSRCSDVT